PLFLFGLAAPALLVLAMTGLALYLVEQALHDSRVALVGQLQESDLVSASLVANVVQQEVLARRKRLEHHAADPEVRRAVQARDRARLDALLAGFNRQSVSQQPLAWVLVDDRGRLLASSLENVRDRLPPEFQMPEDFADRDWFNGRGHLPDRGGG